MIIASVVSFIKFLIGGYLLYNVVLVSATQQHESAISIHISPPSHPYPIPPLYVVIGHQFEFPVLHSNFSLNICFTYDNA